MLGPMGVWRQLPGLRTDGRDCQQDRFPGLVGRQRAEE